MFKLDMKVVAKINGRERAGKIHDFTYDQKRIWVETAEDFYVVDAEDVTIVEEPVVAEEPVKAPAKKAKKVVSGKLEFGTQMADKYDEFSERYLTAYLTLNSKVVTGQALADLYDEVEEFVLEQLDGDVIIEPSRCGEYEDTYCGDALELSVEYGETAEAKKAVKTAWKLAKAKFNLR